MNKVIGKMSILALILFISLRKDCGQLMGQLGIFAYSSCVKHSLMSEVNFYLKKKEPSTGKSLIYLQFKYNGRKLVFSFGQTLKPGKKYWNAGKQRVVSNKTTTADGKYSLNDLLDNLKSVCEEAYHKELKNGIPEPETIRKQLQAFLDRNKKDSSQKKSSLFTLIDRFINNEINAEGNLADFAMKEKYAIDFDTINLDFFYKYVGFLKRVKKMKQNTIAKSVNTLKVFMNEAVDLGLTNNVAFKQRKFNVGREETDAIYLTEDEILRLYKHDLSRNKKLEEVRDLFVFGSFVGLRFSDYSQIKPENIVTIDGDLYIKLITAKTKDLVIIPTNPLILQLFEKYKGNRNRLPKSISNQKFNDYIKDVCEAAGLKEKGRLSTDPDLELYRCVSSHTARRSFATNLYLEGYPTYEIMKVTGHKTEQSFRKYIKVTKLDAAKKLSKHIKKNWSEKMLKVAAA
jgi:integrase